MDEQVNQREFHHLVNQVEGTFTEEPILWARDIYGLLDEKNQELARLWAGDLNEQEPQIQEGILAQMLSARGAELAAAIFYRKLGHHVEDIALTQLSGGTEWKSYDLRLDDALAIDVKNSRTPYNSRRTYIEHIVPRFKNARGKREVVIAGVLSPYVNYSNLVGDPSASSTLEEPIYILGETSMQMIGQLNARFQTSNLKLRLIDGNRAPARSHRVGVVIPHWLFDYSDRYYAKRREAFRKLRAFPDERFPELNGQMGYKRRLPIGLLLAAQRPLPDRWRRALFPWQWDFYHRLIGDKPVSLPELFLSILQHFTEAVQSPPLDYDPRGYLEIVTFTKAERSIPAFDTVTRLPAVRDPLNSIPYLIRNLSKIWQLRTQVDLHAYTEFRYKGLGVLRARRSGELTWTTLIAYCGGETHQKVKCGYPDLVIGENAVCRTCHHLICPKCDFCQRDCEGYLERQSTPSESRTFDQVMDDFQSDSPTDTYNLEDSTGDGIPF